MLLPLLMLRNPWKTEAQSSYLGVCEEYAVGLLSKGGREVSE